MCYGNFVFVEKILKKLWDKGHPILNKSITFSHQQNDNFCFTPSSIGTGSKSKVQKSVQIEPRKGNQSKHCRHKEIDRNIFIDNKKYFLKCWRQFHILYGPLLRGNHSLKTPPHSIDPKIRAICSVTMRSMLDAKVRIVWPRLSCYAIFFHIAKHRQLEHLFLHMPV